MMQAGSRPSKAARKSESATAADTRGGVGMGNGEVVEKPTLPVAGPSVSGFMSMRSSESC